MKFRQKLAGLRLAARRVFVSCGPVSKPRVCLLSSILCLSLSLSSFVPLACAQPATEQSIAEPVMWPAALSPGAGDNTQSRNAVPSGLLNNSMPPVAPSSLAPMQVVGAESPAMQPGQAMPVPMSGMPGSAMQSEQAMLRPAMPVPSTQQGQAMPAMPAPAMQPGQAMPMSAMTGPAMQPGQAMPISAMPGPAMQPGQAMPRPAMPSSPSSSSSSRKASKKSKEKTDKVNPAPSAAVAPVVKPELSRWLDRNRPIRAAILCIHGLGLNSNSYQDFGNLMAHKGYAVYALDVRGFGEWMQANGKARINFDKTMLDIQNGLKLIHNLHSGLPVIVLGESMGGAIALRAAADYPDLIQGLISSVPAGDRFKQADTSISVFLHALKGMKKDFDEGDKVINQATDNAQLRSAWRNDPLDRLEFSPEDLLQFQQFMNGNHASVKKITDKPVVFFQGQADHLVKPQGTEKLFAEIVSPAKTMIVLGSCEHLIFEEAKYTRSVQAFDLLETWLNANLPQ